MAALQLRPPEPFNFKNLDDWPRWRRRFEYFRVASGLGTSEERQQVSTFLYCIGEEAEGVLGSTGITEDERKDYQIVLGKFDGYFQVRRNIIYERARFNTWNQEEGETAEKYITEHYALVDNCNYGDMRDEMIRDRLVVGIQDAALSQQLQFNSELTLEKAKTRIRQREAVGQQQKALKAPPIANAADIEQLHFRRRPTLSNEGHRRTTQNRGDRSGKPKDKPLHKKCYRCGNEPHPREKCPTKDATCNRCNKKGHYAALCLMKQTQVAAIQSETDAVFLGELKSQQNPTWLTTLDVKGYGLQFKLDTVAEVTAISEDAYNTIQSPQVLPSTKIVYGSSRQLLHCTGQFPGKFSHKGKVATQPVFVIKGLKFNLVGHPAITELRLVTRLDLTEATEEYQKQFPSLFEGLGNQRSGPPLHLYSETSSPTPRRESQTRVGRWSPWESLRRAATQHHGVRGLWSFPKRTVKSGFAST